LGDCGQGGGTAIRSAASWAAADVGLADSTGSIINLLSTAGLLVLPSQSSLFAGDGLSLGLAFKSYFSLFGFDLNL